LFGFFDTPESAQKKSFHEQHLLSGFNGSRLRPAVAGPRTDKHTLFEPLKSRPRWAAFWL